MWPEEVCTGTVGAKESRKLGEAGPSGLRFLGEERRARRRGGRRTRGRRRGRPCGATDARPSVEWDPRSGPRRGDGTKESGETARPAPRGYGQSAVGGSMSRGGKARDACTQEAVEGEIDRRDPASASCTVAVPPVSGGAPMSPSSHRRRRELDGLCLRARFRCRALGGLVEPVTRMDYCGSCVTSRSQVDRSEGGCRTSFLSGPLGTTGTGVEACYF